LSERLSHSQRGKIKDRNFVCWLPVAFKEIIFIPAGSTVITAALALLLFQLLDTTEAALP
jgi:hypothetical protein